MGKPIIQFTIALLLFATMISCGKQSNEEPISVEIVEDSAIPLDIDFAFYESWTTEDLYIFPIVIDSILKLRAYDVNLKEIVWEINYQSHYYQQYKGQLHDERYLCYYYNEKISILDLTTLKWITIDENILIPGFVSAGNFYTYHEGKIYGFLNAENLYSIIYSFDLESYKTQIEYSYTMQDFETSFTSVVVENGENGKLSIYAALNENNDNNVDGFKKRCKLLKIEDGEVAQEKIIEEFTETFYSFVTSMRLHRDNIILSGYQDRVYVIDKDSINVISQRDIFSNNRINNIDVIGNRLYVLGFFEFEEFDFNLLTWQSYERHSYEQPSNLSDVQLEEDFLVYALTKIDYSNNYDVDSNLKVINRNNSVAVLKEMSDKTFSSPKYIPFLDQYIYHTHSRIIWFDLEIEED